MTENGRKIQNPDYYTEIAFSVPMTIQDAVCNFIIDNYTSGLILEDESGSDEIGIKFYIEDMKDFEDTRDRLVDYINEISEGIGFSKDRINVRNVKNLMWEEAYRESVKPIVVDNIIVRPPWFDNISDSQIDIIIEPKMAFGTGTHETTQLCMKAIYDNFKPGWTLFDLGCGSGILSILAAKLGAEKVVGADIEPIACDNSLENIEINKVADKIVILEGSSEHLAHYDKFDFIVANIIRETILELFDDIYKSAKRGGVIVLSGLLLDDKEPVAKLLNNYDIERYKVNQIGEWLAFIINK